MAMREVSHVPVGMIVERTEVDGERIVIWVRSRAERGVCTTRHAETKQHFFGTTWPTQSCRSHRSHWYDWISPHSGHW
jgi:hypothetical protein